MTAGSQQPISVVNITAGGSRGLWNLGDGIALVPFQSSVCDAAQEHQIYDRFYMTAKKVGEKQVYRFLAFDLREEKETIPLGSVETPTTTIKDTPSGREVTVNWKYTQDKANVLGYAINYGVKNSKQLYSHYTGSPDATTFTFTLEKELYGKPAVLSVSLPMLLASVINRHQQPDTLNTT